MEKKPIIFSGIQPTAVPTLGNYLGALKNWVAMQDEYFCIYSIVDLHAITVRQDPAKLHQQSLDSYALLLACGVDPDKSIAFLQSHVSAHAELSWILSCYTQFGELSRMTQFKEKSASHADNVNGGLFTYPVLMAADILLYQTDLVPVGIDQKQHVELARNIAERFNGVYGQTFKVPEPYIPKVGAKIMSLADPTKKMSKSDPNPNGFIGILDEKDVIIRKCRRAVTDSETEVVYREGKDGVNNLLTIYALCTDKTIAEAEAEFAGVGYGDFKAAVGEAAADHLAPVRERFRRFTADKDFLVASYTEGARRAASLANRTLEKAAKKVGFIKK